MIRVRLALAALLLVPVVAGAQMGRSGIGSRTGEADARRARSEIDREALPPMKLKVSDLEDANPVHVLLDEKKALKLTEEQQAKLKELRSMVGKTNEPLMAKFDSLRIALRPIPNMSDEDKIRQTIGREELGTVLRAVRASYAAVVPQAMALLDEAQKPKAQELVAKQSQDTDKMIREKVGGGSGSPGGPGGGRPGRPPPGG